MGNVKQNGIRWVNPILTIVLPKSTLLIDLSMLRSAQDKSPRNMLPDVHQIHPVVRIQAKIMANYVHTFDQSGRTTVNFSKYENEGKRRGVYLKANIVTSAPDNMHITTGATAKLTQ